LKWGRTSESAYGFQDEGIRFYASPKHYALEQSLTVSFLAEVSESYTKRS
jgi:hypothetical protein